jgi:hypothetical protein
MTWTKEQHKQYMQRWGMMHRKEKAEYMRAWRKKRKAEIEAAMNELKALKEAIQKQQEK